MMMDLLTRENAVTAVISSSANQDTQHTSNSQNNSFNNTIDPTLKDNKDNKEANLNRSRQFDNVLRGLVSEVED